MKIKLAKSEEEKKNTVQSETEGAAEKVRWHQKKWVRIIAMCLIIVLVSTEIILHFIEGNSRTGAEVMKPETLLNPQLQEIFETPLEFGKALKQAILEREELTELGEQANRYIEKGEYEKAIEPVGELLDLMDVNDTQRTPLMMVRAALCFTSEQFEDARADCTELIEDGYDTDGYYSFMRSVCYLQEESYEKSRDDLLAALEKGYQDDALCYVHLAFCENYLENYEKVLEYASMAREKGAAEIYRTTLLYLQAVASLKQEKFADSIAYIDELTADEAFAKEGELFYYRGVSYLALEEYQKAYDDFEQAFSSGSEDTSLYYNRGVAALGLNRLEEAQKDLEEVVARGDEKELSEAAEEILEILKQGDFA